MSEIWDHSTMKHIMFLFVDHFEPEDKRVVKEWVERYPRIAEKHRDADNNPPKHTWFYAGTDLEVLDSLSRLCARGYGEIELHLHHSYDNEESLTRLIEERKNLFAQAGALITTASSPQRVYGFIHGKWALDNSRGAKYCGVNNELQVLKKTGCFADFTFPAWGPMQPRKRNSIYYATDDPAKAKSYDWGVDVEKGKEGKGDLLIFQGPGFLSGFPEPIGRITPLNKMFNSLIPTCGISYYSPPTRKRIDRWVKTNVQVQGQPDWIFVKVHTHGAREKNYEAYFGLMAETMFQYLEAKYNDRINYQLHYVTAREAYNMVKAAEAGEKGNPTKYRNYRISPYQNTV